MGKGRFEIPQEETFEQRLLSKMKDDILLAPQCLRAIYPVWMLIRHTLQVHDQNRTSVVRRLE